MAVKTSFARVLVTGANSFYAAAIMDKLVLQDIKIHAAVRSEPASPPLRERYGDAIEVFIVPDITLQGAFQSAIKGCDAAIHVASPFRHNFNDARTDMLDPAINGAISLLEAVDAEPCVRRVVFTSSIAACIDPTHPSGFKRPGYVYTEKDWNPLTYEQASTYKAFPRFIPHPKAWRKRLPAVNFTNADLSKLMDGEEDGLPHLIMPWMTDIDEVAQAHVKALYNPRANGRYIIANSRYDFQQVVDIMHENFPDSDWIKNVPKGPSPGVQSDEVVFTLDNTRSREELGVEYKPWQQSVIEFCTKYGEERKKFM